jgi:hypothetical protein
MTSLRMRQKTEKAFTKWLPGMFQTHLQSLAKVYTSTSGLCWKKCSLNDRRVLYFSEIKLFREHFEATKYMYIGTHDDGNYYCFLLWSSIVQIFLPVPVTLDYISLGFSLSLPGFSI